jgi:hypothetical protein
MADPAYIVDGVLTDGEAWVGIATTTVVGTSTATITFTSPDDGSSTDWSQFMDLVLISYAAGEAVGGTNSSYVRFNSDTGSNYPYQWSSGRFIHQPDVYRRYAGYCFPSALGVQRIDHVRYQLGEIQVGILSVCW